LARVSTGATARTEPRPPTAVACVQPGARPAILSSRLCDPVRNRSSRRSCGRAGRCTGTSRNSGGRLSVRWPRPPTCPT